MPFSSIFERFRKPARKSVDHRRLSMSSIDAAIKAELSQPPTTPNAFNNNPSLVPEVPTETVLEAAPDVVEMFVMPEVVPQEDGYRSLLPEDAIPNLQTVLASCGGLMVSFSTGNGLLEGRNVIELEHTIIQVLQRIRILRNDARPIGKLPPELLTPIFDLVATPSEDVDSTSSFTNLMSLVHVCHYWRAILLNHCGAWSNVHLRGQDPNFLAWQMAYSRSAPLDVTVHLYSNSGNRLLHNFQASVKTIREHRERVRGLSVHAVRHHYPRNLFGFEFPNLEELAWDVRGLDPPVQLVGAPKLWSLSVKGTLNWPVVSVTGLTRFKLEGPMAVTVTDISNFLKQNNTLKSLEFANLHVPAGTPGQIRSVKLHNLTALSFRNVEHGHILSCLSLPALENLYVGSFEQPIWWSRTVWHNLTLPSGIASLNVKYCGWEGGFDRVRITGFDDARTRSLNLTEHSLGTRFNPMLSALAYTPLHTVTSISFDEEETNDPRYQLVSPPLRIILGNMPNLRRMDLCWGHLTHQIVEQLRHTCPELKVLRVKTTRLSCSATFDLVLQMAKARAAARMWLNEIECIAAEEEGDAAKIKELWDTWARNAELGRYLGDRPGEVTEVSG